VKQPRPGATVTAGAASPATTTLKVLAGQSAHLGQLQPIRDGDPRDRIDFSYLNVASRDITVVC
jgi:hypothetical protein